MMTGILPLVLLWMAGRGGGSPTAATFRWPTPASPPPPPPMPAFQPGPAPAADANTGTPLQDLAAAKPGPRHPAAAKGPRKKPRAPKAQQAASPLSQAKAAAKARLKNAALSRGRAAFSVPLPATQSASVLELQKIVRAHGVAIKPDGLYGPRTANAWAQVANEKGLPPTILRGGPKVAKVVAKTYDALKMPEIP